ncbi:hypothetical protein L6452_31331 [Arctium lappa]|uniref:Uncharacterized protein n=1 Tax=Arctium lappa TaxID=4217 RepID=A0ACB8ZKQ8_ARCLA|nr:hypothetical protein L6452_31331 [Arctium lappa]
MAEVLKCRTTNATWLALESAYGDDSLSDFPAHGRHERSSINRGCSNNYNNHGGNQPNHGHGRINHNSGYSGGRGRSRDHTCTPKCQICKEFGHFVDKCSSKYSPDNTTHLSFSFAAACHVS